MLLFSRKYIYTLGRRFIGEFLKFEEEREGIALVMKEEVGLPLGC